MQVKLISSKEALELRQIVLWPDREIEFCILPDDDKGLHYGLYIDEILLSVASIFIEKRVARLRKFATLKEYQGRGYGTFLLSYIIDDLKARDCIKLWCDARKTAEKFYNRFNMYKTSDVFYKSEKKYIKMQMDINPSP